MLNDFSKKVHVSSKSNFREKRNIIFRKITTLFTFLHHSKIQQIHKATFTETFPNMGGIVQIFPFKELFPLKNHFFLHRVLKEWAKNMSIQGTQRTFDGDKEIVLVEREVFLATAVYSKPVKKERKIFLHPIQLCYIHCKKTVKLLKVL